MEAVPTDVLLELVRGSTEPLVVVQLDDPDWPIVLANPAFGLIADRDTVDGEPFPNIAEAMIGREMAREAAGAMRASTAATLPVDVSSREFLLEVLPVASTDPQPARYAVVYLRTAGRQLAATSASGSFRALARVTRRVRDMSAEDVVTGLMNERAFRDMLSHDWAVAAREDALIGLTAFCFDDFDAYRHVFGRHGADSCLRRVSTIIRRCLKRASDVAARLDGPGGGWIIALTHGSDETGLIDFAGRIAAAVADLRMHHPRSTVNKYVTVSFRSKTYRPREGRPTATECLGRLLTG